jgi:ferritin-like metal-binding protein YciE
MQVRLAATGLACFFKALLKQITMATLLTLHHLLLHEIEDLYSAEEQIIDALPAMIEKATDRELKKALTDHLKVTKDQKKRLDEVKELLQPEDGETEEQKGFFERIFGGNKKCKGTEGLIKEGEKMMKEDMDPKVMDAAIIAAAQKIEHYEISGYGTARAYAAELGLQQVARLLETTLNEEYYADDSLTSLAMSKVNLEAERGSGNGGRNRMQLSGGGRNESARSGSRSSSSGNGSLRGSSAKKAAKKSAVKKRAAKKGAVPKKAASKAATKKGAKKKTRR